jgi:hypothetical protein
MRVGATMGRNPVSVAVSNPRQQGVSRTVTPMGAANPGFIGAPYCAEQVSETVQTLADGTKITRTGPVARTCRDSHGRVRRESPLWSGPPPERETLSTIEIFDPIGGMQYFLDTQNGIAHRYRLPPGAGPRGVPVSAGAPHWVDSTAVDANGVTTKTEVLGTQMFDGLPAEGRRTTRTTSVGQGGAGQLLDTVDEVWISVDLGIYLLQKTSDPRTGEKVQKATVVSRAEPELSLFQPPADYRVVDETGPVTITYTPPPPRRVPR